MLAKRTLIFIVGIAVLVLGGLAIADYRDDDDDDKDEAEVRWNPPVIVERLLAGDSTEITVNFQLEDDEDQILLEVSEELSQIVSVNPRVFFDVEEEHQHSIDVAISAPANALPGTFNGAIHLRSIDDDEDDDDEDSDENDDDDKETIAPPLPVSLEIVWETVVEESSGITLTIPGGLVAQQGGGYLVVGDSSNMTHGLPGKFSIIIYDTPPEFVTLSHEVALVELAFLSGLEPGDIITQTFRNNGLDLTTRSFTRQHFFLYNSISNKGVEFLSLEEGFFLSEAFGVILNSLSF